jgi:hypothetical protein
MRVVRRLRASSSRCSMPATSSTMEDTMGLRHLDHVAVLLAALAAAGAARAETSGVSAAGFLVTHRLEAKASPARLFEAVGQIGRWWNVEHSYSGQGANLTLDLNAGGCFCERWSGGSVLHAQVVFVDRTNHVVRLLGALGPLQERAIHGVLTFAAGVVEGKTMLTVTYRVAGPSDVGLEKSAAPVDQVIGDAARRLVSHAESGRP